MSILLLSPTAANERKLQPCREGSPNPASPLKSIPLAIMEATTTWGEENTSHSEPDDQKKV